MWCIQSLQDLRRGISSQDEVLKKQVLRQPLLFGALLFGGHVVDGEWLERAKEHHAVAGDLVEPHWQLIGGMQEPLELHMTPSFSTKWNEISVLIAEAKGDRLRKRDLRVDTCLLSRWTVVKCHRDVHQEKKALILCGDAAEAQELNEEQGKQLAKVAELTEQVKKLKETRPPPSSLPAHLRRLKNAKAQVRKGRAIDPEMFVSIFLSMCTLAR